MKYEIFFRAMLSLLFCSTAQAGSAAAENTYKVPKHVIATAVQAAKSQGVDEPLKPELVDSLKLAMMYDPGELTGPEAKSQSGLNGNPLQVQIAYLKLSSEGGGGCITALRWKDSKKDLPTAIGVTDMRCAKTQSGFERLLKVALIAMDV